jgi:hypothetical protein
VTSGMSDNTGHSTSAPSLDDIIANVAAKSVCIWTALVFGNNVIQYVQNVAKLPRCC